MQCCRSSAALIRPGLQNSCFKPRYFTSVTITPIEPDPAPEFSITWPVHVINQVQLLCAQRNDAMTATVTDYSTEAVKRVGKATIRLAFNEGFSPHEGAGGYLIGVRRGNHNGKVLPALAGIPTEKDSGAVAEAIVLGRPVGEDSGTVTFLSDSILREFYPVGSTVEIHVLHRCSDFYIGRWSFDLRLKNRMRMISEVSLAHIQAQQGEEQGRPPSIIEALEGTGLRLDSHGLLEAWPELKAGRVEHHVSGYSGKALERGKIASNIAAARAKRPPARGVRLDDDPRGFYHAYRSAQ